MLWKKVLEADLGPLDFRRLDSLGDKADIEVALAWKPAPGLLASFPNLKLIVSLGMGVDHLLSDDKLRPMCRSRASWMTGLSAR